MVHKSFKMHKNIESGEMLTGDKVILRPVLLSDCNERYLGWLNNPRINQYLETRWSLQNLDSIRQFVVSMLDDPSNYLFAIIEVATQTHIGNIKVGPINFHHLYSDVSYFIGEPSAWGKGYATEAIILASRFAFNRLKLRRLQAGFYASNKGSQRALAKANYKLEAVFKNQLRLESSWEDHHWYVLFNTEDS